MIFIEEKSRCSGCHACSNVCPKNCIQMISDEEGFWYPQIDKEKCINCSMCEKVCPSIHKWQPYESREAIAMAAINLNNKIRSKSSSGGIFTLIAEEIIKQGGVVFGAAFADDFRSVHHIFVDNPNDLEKLRGSKYVQSSIGETYKLAKEFLDCGRKVLFTGTPCQIEGLYSFLNNSYDNLLLVDFVCHGVPSPGIWKKYLDYREGKDGKVIDEITFRSKKRNWRQYYFSYRTNNGKTINIHRSDDPFLQSFLKSYSLRPSCYSCRFKGKERLADITLSDFWMVNQFLNGMDDEMGTSLLYIHSTKGLDIISNIKSYIVSQKVGFDETADVNTAMIDSSTCPNGRSVFFERINTDGWADVCKTMFPKRKLNTKIIDWLKSTKRKIRHNYTHIKSLL